jgi:hypothetical protein
MALVKKNGGLMLLLYGWEFSMHPLKDFKFYSGSLESSYTVKGARGKVSFDSQNDKYASQLSCDTSSEAYW